MRTKQKKRNIRSAAAALIAAAATLSLLSCGVEEAPEKEKTYSSGNFIVEATGDGCIVRGYQGTESRVSVPPEIDGLPVVGIGEFAFYGCVALTDIELPPGVRQISRAFAECPDLRTASLGGGVTDMEGAFSGCASLVSADGYDRAEHMQDAFSGCVSLRSCVIPSTAVDCTGAFSGCVSLSDVTVCEGAAGLDGTFANCTSLKSVTLPQSVTELRDTFRGCVALTDVEGLENVTALYGSFAGCSSLAGVSLGRFVTDMHGAFTGCAKLVRVGNMPRSLETYSASFGGCSSLTYLRIPVINNPESEAEYNAADDFRGCRSLENVIIDCDVTAYSDFCSAFGDCSSLVALTVTEETLGRYFDVGYVFADEIYEGDDYRVRNTVLSYLHDGGARSVYGFAELDGVVYSRITGGDIGYFDADETAASMSPSGFAGFERSLIWFGFPSEGERTDEVKAVTRTYEFCLVPTGEGGRLPDSFYVNGSLCRTDG